eukprot:TRINITY_DN45878_c0_g1_i1.p1 TRINITY_DN45878_c0_g1~~TRINITY_DN45878_c0_g1_i1.p1  ORF type:complete len:902 (+),score=62.97 TRINITY_DN45878_c0_g1_i1:131-2707(+)
MTVANRQVDLSQGSLVQLAKTEYTLLVHLERARDFMLNILSHPTQGRVVLSEIFGGDCIRIARLRAILDERTWSPRHAQDQRIQSTRRALESVEKVLADLGQGAQMRAALTAEKEQLHMQTDRDDESTTQQATLLPVPPRMTSTGAVRAGIAFSDYVLHSVEQVQGFQKSSAGSPGHALSPFSSQRVQSSGKVAQLMSPTGVIASPQPVDFSPKAALLPNVVAAPVMSAPCVLGSPFALDLSPRVPVVPKVVSAPVFPAPGARVNQVGFEMSPRAGVLPSFMTAPVLSAPHTFVSQNAVDISPRAGVSPSGASCSTARMISGPAVIRSQSGIDVSPSTRVVPNVVAAPMLLAPTVLSGHSSSDASPKAVASMNTVSAPLTFASSFLRSQSGVDMSPKPGILPTKASAPAFSSVPGILRKQNTNAISPIAGILISAVPVPLTCGSSVLRSQSGIELSPRIGLPPNANVTHAVSAPNVLQRQDAVDTSPKANVLLNAVISGSSQNRSHSAAVPPSAGVPLNVVAEPVLLPSSPCALATQSSSNLSPKAGAGASPNNAGEPAEAAAFLSAPSPLTSQREHITSMLVSGHPALSPSSCARSPRLTAQNSLRATSETTSFKDVLTLLASSGRAVVAPPLAAAEPTPETVISAPEHNVETTAANSADNSKKPTGHWEEIEHRVITKGKRWVNDAPCQAQQRQHSVVCPPTSPRPQLSNANVHVRVGPVISLPPVAVGTRVVTSNVAHISNPVRAPAMMLQRVASPVAVSSPPAEPTAVRSPAPAPVTSGNGAAVTVIRNPFTSPGSPNPVRAPSRAPASASVAGSVTRSSEATFRATSPRGHWEEYDIVNFKKERRWVEDPILN